MPIGGESIGRAYVRILADGTGFEADAEREIREAEPTFEKGGERHSKAYMKGFRSGMPRKGKTPLQPFTDALAQGRGLYDRIGSLLAGGLMEGFEDEVRDLFPDVGDRIVDNLRNSLAKGDINERGLIARLRNLRREAAIAYQGMADDGARAFNELAESVKRYGTELGRGGPSRSQLLADMRHLTEVLPDVVTEGREFNAMLREMRTRLTTVSPVLVRAEESYRRFGDTVGRVFGRGSRNDLLNFFGSVARGATLIGQPILRAAQHVNTFRRTITEASREGAGFFSSLGQGIASIGGPLVQLVTTAALVKVVISTIGALGAAASLATSGVLALAGSLSYALVGGLVAVSGALFPLASGLGVVALAIAGLNKESKAVESLGDSFKDLQKIAARGVFGRDGGGLVNVERLLKSIEPIVRTVSTALGGLLESLGKAAQSKDFITLMQDLSNILGPMVTQLGKIGGNLTIGLLQLFRDGAPLVQNFLNWLERLTKAFRDAGDAGKNTSFSPLVQFLDNAGDSARVVWRLIDNVIKIIGDLFKAGKGTGDDLFGKMADKAEELHKWLSDPANSETIEQWFEDGGKFLTKLGEILLKIGEVIDALDTPTNRMFLFQLLDVTADLLGWLAKILTKVDEINTKLLEEGGKALDSFGEKIEEVANGSAWNSLKTRIDEAFNGTALDSFKQRLAEAFDGTAFDSFSQRAKEAVDGIKGFFAPLGTWFSQLWTSIKAKAAEAWEGMSQRPREAVDKIKQIFQDLYNWLVGNSLIPDLVMAIAGWFGRLPGMIAAVLGNLALVFVKWVAGVPAAILGVIDKIVAPFRGLAGKIIAGAGNLASQFGTWVSSLPGKARANAKSIADAYSGLASKAVAKMGSFTRAISDWFSSAPGRARTNANAIANAYSGLAKDAMRKAGNLGYAVEDWGQKAVSAANRTANAIVDQFSGLNRRIIREIGPVEIKVKVIIPPIPRPTVTAKVEVPETASGGVFSGAQVRMIGEAGPEAVVPLNRSLSQVDPAVRALSAFAQGLKIPNTADGAVVGGDAKMNVTIITPTEDPRAVASEVFARFAAASYI